MKVDGNDIKSKITQSKVRYYHFFNDFFDIRNNKILNIINGYLLTLQCHLGINRHKEDIWYGSSWFSITDNLARDLVEFKEYFIKKYKYTNCADEMFIQTYICNNMKNKYCLYDNGNFRANKRQVDWARGNPYVYRVEDFTELKNSNCIFARKFDANLDASIIDNIYQYINNKQNC